MAQDQILTRAENLFRQFQSGKLEMIEKLVSDRWIETDILDCKIAAQGCAPMRPEDLKNLSKALSGFANESGGLIVWGVYAAKGQAGLDGDEEDVARELKPIRKLRQFVSELHSNASQLTEPAVSGVQHLEISSDFEGDSGYVVTFIPKSDGFPHIATGKDLNRPYYRGSNSFLVMSHSMLADRFSRRPQPHIEFFWHVSPNSYDHYNSDRETSISITVGIKNVGRGVARFPALKIIHNEHVRLNDMGLDGNRKPGLPKIPTEGITGQGYTTLFAGGGDLVIYPGMEYAVIKLLCSFMKGQKRVNDCKINYEIYCDGHSDKGEATVAYSSLNRGPLE